MCTFKPKPLGMTSERIHAHNKNEKLHKTNNNVIKNNRLPGIKQPSRF